MPRIIWDESFSVNNVEIDNQHKKFMEIINELHDAIITGENAIGITKKSVAAMIEYGEFHFSYEEDAMRKVGFPGIDKHIDSHKAFLDKMRRIQQKQNKGAIILNRELMDELMNWLLDHILEEDHQISDYIQSSK